MVRVPRGRVVLERWSVAGDLDGKGTGKVFAGHGYAWPTRDQPATTFFFNFDHIFLRGVAVVETGVVRDIDGVSDHRPVWATIVVPSTTDATGSDVPRAQGSA